MVLLVEPTWLAFGSGAAEIARARSRLEASDSYHRAVYPVTAELDPI